MLEYKIDLEKEEHPKQYAIKILEHSLDVVDIGSMHFVNADSK
jgi:hypothetical protein